MKELFGVPQIVAEERERTLKTTKPGKKPGFNWAIILIMTVLVFFFAKLVAEMPQLVLIIAKGIAKNKPDMLPFNPDSEGVLIAFRIITRVCLVLVTIAFVFYARIMEGRKARSLGFIKEHAVTDYLIGLAAGFGIFSLAVLICKLTGSINIAFNENPDYLAVALFAIGWFFQGMEEEVVCRGYMMSALARRYSLPVGVLINSLFFSSIHIINNNVTVLALFNIFLFGVFASLIFIKTGSIWMCSAIHTIWNYVQGNLYGIKVSGNDAMPSVLGVSFVSGKELINGGAFGLEGGLGVTIVLLIGCVIVYFIPTRKAKAEVEVVNAA